MFTSSSLVTAQNAFLRHLTRNRNSAKETKTQIKQNCDHETVAAAQLTLTATEQRENQTGKKCDDKSQPEGRSRIFVKPEIRNDRSDGQRGTEERQQNSDNAKDGGEMHELEEGQTNLEKSFHHRDLFLVEQE